MKSELERNKAILFQRHDYDPRKMTHNVHHIVYKRDGGKNDLENLALLPADLHDWIHKLDELIRRNN